MTRLTIEPLEAGQGYRFHLDGPRPISDKRRLLSGEWKALSRALDSLAAVVHPAPWQAPGPGEPGAVARVLAQLLPDPIQEALPPSPQLVLLDSTGLPWELAFPGAVRELQGQEARSADSKKPARLLMVVDPGDALPWTRAEADVLRYLLEPRFEVEVLAGQEARCDRVASALASGRFGAVHLAAYADQGPTLYCSDGPLPLEECRPAPSAGSPRLAYLNLYWAGDPAGARPVGDLLISCAREFAVLGVECIVGPLWELAPQTSQAVASLFYQTLVQDQTVLGAWKAVDSFSGFAAFGNLEMTCDALRPTLVAPSKTLPSRQKPDFRIVVVEGPEEGREIDFYSRSFDGGRTLVIGSPGPRPADIELDDESLPNQAAGLKLEAGRLTLETLSGEVQVNGLPVVGRVGLEGWEHVTMGETRLRFERPSADDEAGGDGWERGRFCLVVLEGEPQDTGRRLPIAEAFTLVGRQPDCALALKDPTVSRQQFSVVVRERRFFLSHAGSNPTIVNGLPVESEVELRHGDRIQVGTATLLAFQDSHREGGA